MTEMEQLLEWRELADFSRGEILPIPVIYRC